MLLHGLTSGFTAFAFLKLEVVKTKRTSLGNKIQNIITEKIYIIIIFDLITLDIHSRYDMRNNRFGQ